LPFNTRASLEFDVLMPVCSKGRAPLMVASRLLTDPSGAQGSSADRSWPQSLRQEPLLCNRPVEIGNQNGNFEAVPKVSSQLSTGKRGADGDRGFSGAGSAAPRLLEIAAHLRLFAGVERETLEQIAHDAEWFSLPGGWTLFREGEAPDGLYVVASGRLAVTTRDEAGRESLLAYILAGETVGEMALLSGAPRSATVVAVRDTELLHIPALDFDGLFTRYPSFAHFISKLLVERLAHSSHRHPSLEAPRSVALLPLSEGIPLTELAHSLCDALLRMGLRAQVLDTACARLDVEWHGSVGDANDVVIYQADVQANPWTRLCIRQSDHVLAVADASAPAPPASARIGALLPRGHPGALELLVVHRDPSCGPPWLEDLIARIGAGFHMHARLGNRADIDRLARLLTGRAVGVVLSGGAARGFAHLGVIQALREAGVPIDMVAGTSIGALIAAGVGVERDTMDEEMREAFVVRNPLSDYTLPIVSIFRGRRTSRLLREHGRGLRVGDCWRPYFCTSSNLSSGNVRVHRDGPLWRAVRASMAIPGVLPPVIDGGEVLVDGGVLNNMPADVMLAMRRGPVIAVDVCRKSGFSASAVDLDELPLWKMISGKRRGVPNILALLVRAGTISSQAQVKALASRVDLLIEPKLDGVAMLDWHAFDRAVKAGYHQTVVQLQNEPHAIRRLTSPESPAAP
jgi:NTE family protein